MSVKFLHNSGAMCGHGFEAYSQSFRNLLGTLSVCDQLQDLLFTAGQERTTFACEGQQLLYQLSAFLAGLQRLLEPGERGMSLWQIVKCYVEAPSNGGQNRVKVLGHQGTKVADRLHFVRADVSDDEPEVQRLTIGTNGVKTCQTNSSIGASVHRNAVDLDVENRRLVLKDFAA